MTRPLRQPPPAPTGFRFPEWAYRSSISQAHLAPVGKVDAGALARAFVELETSVVDALGYGRERLDLRRAATMRYAGQAFELSVPLPDALVDQIRSRVWSQIK